MDRRLRYPLAVSTWDEAEMEAAIRSLRSGRTTMADTVAAFEREFALFTGSRYAVMVNSGSSANLLMIAALVHRNTRRLERGDEVIVPAVSWPTTYYPLYQYGLRLVFVDVERDTLNLDPDAVAAAITPKTRAIFAVNLLGNPCRFDRLREAIKGRDIVLLEDNCEALGAIFEGRQAGTFGAMGSHSFFFSHHMSTMEGGMVVTDDEELHHFLLALRAHGWTRDLPKKNHVSGEKSDEPFEESFRFLVPGYNVRPLEIEAAIGLEQLKKLPALLEQRRANARHFEALFRGHSWLRMQRHEAGSSWFAFAMMLDGNAPLDRMQLARKLAAAGVECRPVVAGNFAKNPVMRWFDARVEGRLANADWVDARGLMVGNHGYPLAAELDELKRIIEEAP
jgi:CDP-6-deoxy-D-xylo-4-hexulose-3-dehydrase